jgi:hypothetical protein
MIQSKRSNSADLPPWLQQMARHIARDCARPGTYTITLVVPDHKRAARIIDIDRVEAIRRGISLDKKP